LSKNDFAFYSEIIFGAEDKVQKERYYLGSVESKNIKGIIVVLGKKPL